MPVYYDRTTFDVSDETSMIRLNRWPKIVFQPGRAPVTARAKIFWTISNLLMLIGLVMLMYVGGIYSAAEYGRYSARGDTDEPAPQPALPVLQPQPAQQAEPAPFIIPQLNTSTTSASDERLTGLIPDLAQAAMPSNVSRIVIPSIDVDSKVVTVGWEVQEQQGRRVGVWQVAEYAVGHHLGSANPGEKNNIVLAGHVGGYGKVFKDLIDLEPGDPITIYSAGEQYLYTVSEKVILTEEGVSPEQQAANAGYIAPTNYEVVTLVTCWPASGPEKFSQRIVVRATPYSTSTSTNHAGTTVLSNWSVR